MWMLWWKVYFQPWQKEDRGQKIFVLGYEMEGNVAQSPISFEGKTEI